MKDDLCNNFGVECNYLKQVTKLALPFNNLRGELPIQLALLSSVEVIDLTGNELKGILPPHFAHLDSLKILALGGNLLTGNLPNGWASLYNLEVLNLEANYFNGEIPGSLLELRGKGVLREISLGHNSFTKEIPVQLQELNLEKLYLAHNDWWCGKKDGKLPFWTLWVTKAGISDYSSLEMCLDPDIELKYTSPKDLLLNSEGTQQE